MEKIPKQRRSSRCGISSKTTQTRRPKSASPTPLVNATPALNPTTYQKVGAVHPDYSAAYLASNYPDVATLRSFLKKQFFRIRYGKTQLIILTLLIFLVYHFRPLKAPHSHFQEDIKNSILG